MPNCNKSVYREAFGTGPCRNKAKHDSNTKCGIHSKAAVAKRKEKADARIAAWRKEWADRDKRHAAERQGDQLIEQLLNLIESYGHPDSPAGIIVAKIRKAQAEAQKR